MMKISINDKPLYTDDVPIRQYNNLVDTITLTVPRIYNGIDMSEATARIVADGKLSLIEGVTEGIVKSYSDTTISVAWIVGRTYTETAGAVQCQLSFEDEEGVALYTAIFTLHVLDSLTFTEWEEEPQTMWDDYLAQFNALVSHADEVDAKLTAFDEDYADKLQTVKDTANHAIEDIESAQTAAIQAINAKIDAVGWTILPDGDVEVTIEGSGT